MSLTNPEENKKTVNRRKCQVPPKVLQAEVPETNIVKTNLIVKIVTLWYPMRTLF